MTTEAQGTHLLEAWDELLTAMEDAGEEDFEALRDFFTVHSLGGFQVWPHLAAQLSEAAWLAREATRVRKEDQRSEVKA